MLLDLLVEGTTLARKTGRKQCFRGTPFNMKQPPGDRRPRVLVNKALAVPGGFQHLGRSQETVHRSRVQLSWMPQVTIRIVQCSCSHFRSSGLAKQRLNSLFTTKMVLPKSLKSVNSGSEF